MRGGIFAAISLGILLAHYMYLGSKPILNEAARKGAGRSSALLSNGATAYEVANLEGDKPVVVLVPDLVLSSAVWENTFRELSKAKFPILRYDLFGSGFSARPKGHYDLQFFSGQLESLVNKILPGRDLILVGLGDGGAIATEYASTHAGRVEKLVLIDAVGSEYRTPFRARLMRIPAAGCYLGRLLGAGMAKSLIGDSFTTTPAQGMLNALNEQTGKKGFADALRSSFDHWKRVNDHRPYLAAAPKKIPTLIMWGLHDKITPHAGMAELHKILTHAETAVFENSGHAPVIDEPDIVHRRLLQFLQKKD